MTKYVATGNGIRVPLTAKTLDGAMAEIESGGRKFCAHQSFDIERNGKEVAVMVDIKDPSWLEAWGDPEDEAEKYRACDSEAELPSAGPPGGYFHNGKFYALGDNDELYVLDHSPPEKEDM